MPFIGTRPNSGLKDLSIEFKNTKLGVLTKDLCKFQAMKKINNITAPAVAKATIFHHFRI